ncbi:MAG: ribose-phosphate pyrophosphokinase [Oscillospiraceae bacterium]|nr:ribose-phosphate pyrophosphokinase [Oscillospiraceae bacterium]
MFIINNIPVQVERFPDGTPRINISTSDARAVIEWFYEKDEEMILFMITNHLREQCGVVDISLYMPYIPHARMDRVKKVSEVFTLKHFCAFINSMSFSKVTVRDAHSSVSLAMINNVVQEPITEPIVKLVKKLLNPKTDIVFYPDEGSCKRYTEILKFPYAFGIKNRNWEDGSIMGLDIHGDVPKGANVLIIDDISSYGGTFLNSAKKLKKLGAGSIYLYVTHCENAILDGQLIGRNLLEKIYTTKSIFTQTHELIEVIGEAPPAEKETAKPTRRPPKPIKSEE